MENGGERKKKFVGGERIGGEGEGERNGKK